MIETTSVKTQMGQIEFLLPSFSAIPEALRTLPYAFWVADPVIKDGEQRLKPNGRPSFNKAPRGLRGFLISKKLPSEWATFSQVREAFDPQVHTGVGVLLSAKDGIVGIDLDDVADLKKQYPDLEPMLRKAIGSGIYCEKSPSSKGLRLFVSAKLPGRGQHVGGIELYSDVAFLTVTGQTLGDNGGIIEGQWFVDELLHLISRPGGNRRPICTKKIGEESVPSEAGMVLELSEWAAKYVCQLWEGRWDKPRNSIAEKEYLSQSEADMALVGRLAREAAERGCSEAALAATIFDTFTLSGLYREEKRIQIKRYAIPKAIESLEQCTPAKIPKEIAEVNERFALIEGVGIYDRQHGHYVKVEQFRLLYANKLINLGTPEKPRWIDLGSVWLRAEHRAQYVGLEMGPGDEERTKSGALNTYQGFSVEPQNTDIGPFLALTKWLVPDERDRHYLLSWLAYKVQHPAVRYSSAVVMWSVVQGVGKNLLFEAWASLFHKKHWKVVGQEVFSDQFTEWQHLKLVVIADEVSSTSSRMVADRLKGWVTANENQINSKGSPKFSEPNLTSYVFLSNHADAVFMNEHDRRFWVVEGPRERAPEQLTRGFGEWLENDGLGGLLSYLLDFDASSFNPRAPAPMTFSKQEMIEDNKSDLERWLSGILHSGDLSATLGRDLVTVEEMTARYLQNTGNKTSTKAMNGALSRSKVRRLSKQALCKTGLRPRVYALGNHDIYEGMTGTQLGEVLDNSPFKKGPYI